MSSHGKRGTVLDVKTGAARSYIFSWAGLILWSALLVLLTYGRALTLPFMADDFFQFPFVDRHGLSEIMQTAEGLYYFRPLSFVLRKILYLLLGFHSPFVFHLINLLLHLANGLMVGWLAGRLWSEYDQVSNAWLRRYAGATLFLIFPFSYEAVPWISAIVHLLVTFLVLLSLVCFVQFRSTGRLGWIGPGLLFAFLAPFAHETGILVGPFAAVIELTAAGNYSPLWPRIRRVAIWFLPAMVWALIYLTVPTTDDGGGSFTLYSLADVWQNAIYAAQGVSFPLSWLGARLTAITTATEVSTTALLSFAALAGAGIIQALGGKGRIRWLPWLWMAGSLLPAVLFLSFPYLQAAPRALMLASVGIAWLWADVLITVVVWKPAKPILRRLAVVAAVVFALIVTAQSLAYIRRQMKSYEMGGALIDQAVAATVAANAANQTALFINLPVWLAPPQDSFAMGEDGAMLMPAADKIETLVSVHTGEPARIEAIRVDGIRTDVSYHSGLIGSGPDWRELARDPVRIFVAAYEPEQIVIRPAGWLKTGQIEQAPLAHFEELVTLFGVSVSEGDQGLQLDLTWRVDSAVPPDVTVFVHVVDSSGQLVGQADGDPVAGAFPFWMWLPGTIAGDSRPLTADAEVQEIRIGLYNRATGERLTAVSPDGVPLPDNAVVLQLNPGP